MELIFEHIRKMFSSYWFVIPYLHLDFDQSGRSEALWLSPCMEFGSDVFQLLLICPIILGYKSSNVMNKTVLSEITCQQWTKAKEPSFMPHHWSCLPQRRRTHRLRFSDENTRDYVFYTPSPDLTCLRNVIGCCPIAWASPMLALMTSVKGFFPPC